MKTKDGRVVAVLHDVVEDTKYTLEDLRKAGYSRKVSQSLDYLTKRDGEEYEVFIKRIRPHPLAGRVKIADLQPAFLEKLVETLNSGGGQIFWERMGAVRHDLNSAKARLGDKIDGFKQRLQTQDFGTESKLHARLLNLS